MKKSILILINPISGISNKDRIRQLLKEKLNDSDLDYAVKFTGYPGHGTELSQEAAKKGFDAVIVAGGDGSVNEVARGLVNTNTALGIIPTGSGNGLAHFLHIPFNLGKAIENIKAFQIKKIDTFTLNENFGCNLAGVGFDAKVAVEFSKVKRRGFWSYFRIVLQEYLTYESQNYILEFDGKTIKRKALMVCFANSNQFGNNAVIAPDARTDDGLIDVCIISKVPLFEAPVMGTMLVSRLLNKTHYAEYFKTNEVILHKPAGVPLHIDGDPVDTENTIHVKVNPLSLNVIVP
ncbi:MAG: diacylglycerol kinase family lipid kinase [Bacteroidales bacterium]|nr:diacylglycerol kinase family lipid kinase [Bacteroidales bacterium]